MVDRRLFDALAGLSTETRNAHTRDIDLLSTEGVLRAIHAEDRTVSDVVAAVLPRWAEVVDLVVAAFRAGGRLVYVGAGTSGRLGVLDAAECPPTYGTDPGLVIGIIAGGAPTLVRSLEGVEDDEAAALADVDAASIGPKDVVVGLSASRRTPYVLAALSHAAARGSKTVLVCNNASVDRPDPAQVVVEVVTGPEAVTGSTRMKAALAQKMLLTLLTTAAMVRWGKVYENLMVDVAPTSRKLRERARGLVMRLGGVDYDRAAHLLSISGDRVKTAVVMALTSCDVDRADASLADQGGRLRPTLDAWGVRVRSSSDDPE